MAWIVWAWDVIMNMVKVEQKPAWFCHSGNAYKEIVANAIANWQQTTIMNDLKKELWIVSKDSWKEMVDMWLGDITNGSYGYFRDQSQQQGICWPEEQSTHSHAVLANTGGDPQPMTITLQ